MTMDLTPYQEGLLNEIGDTLVREQVRAVFVAGNNAEAENERMRARYRDWVCKARLEERTEAEARLETVTAALAELVRLKDGPRDDAYRAAKEAAWGAARAALSAAPQPEPAKCVHDFTGPHDYEIHGQRGPVDGWHCPGPVSGGAS